MDALLWHQQALTPAPVQPDPVALDAYSRLSRQNQDQYWTDMNAWMASTPIECPRLETLTRQIDRTLQRNHHAPAGAKTILGMSAANGVGKSRFIKNHFQSHYRTLMKGQPLERLPTRAEATGATAIWVPQVYITLRAASEVPEVNASILSFLNYPAIGRTNKDTTRLVEVLARHGVQHLILDDAHMLRAKHTHGRDVLDYIKFLNTILGERGGTVVLVGANMDDSPLYEDPQIAARLATFSLAPYPAMHRAADRAQWQRMLAGVEEKFMAYLDTVTAGTLTREHAGLIWARTQGYLGDTHRLITTALLDAFDAGDTTLTAEHFASVRLSARAEAGQVALTPERTLRSQRDENRKRPQ